jgi:diamine N-acetyltransferase
LEIKKRITSILSLTSFIASYAKSKGDLQSLENLENSIFMEIDMSGGLGIIASSTLSFIEDTSAFRHKPNFGITVHNDCQNRGLGTELTKHMLDIAEKKKLRKVSLGVKVDNAKAIHLYEECGFKIEARLKDEALIDGKYYADYVMSVFL